MLTRAQMRYVVNKPTDFIKQSLTKDDRCQIIMKSDSWFLTRRFLSFLYACVRQTDPIHGAKFFKEHDGLSNLVESDLRIISAKFIWNQTTVL